MKNVTQPYATSAWTAEFEDTAMEQLYRNHQQPAMVRSLSRVLLVWASSLAIYALAEIGQLANTAELFVLLSLRMINIVLVLGLYFALKQKPEWATTGWPITLLCFASFPLFMVMPFVWPEAAPANVTVTIFLLLAIYVFIPNRLMLTNLIAASSITSSAVVFWALGLETSVILSLILLMILPAVIGYTAALRVNSASREAFAQLTSSQSTNKKLEQEIQKRKLLQTKLKQQALTDPLTGLSNRRHYQLTLSRELDRCKRYGTSVVVGMIDLDYFKQINDRFGHEFGDQMLKYAASIMNKRLRRIDMLGRYGGDEFVLILPDTTLQQATSLAVRMRTELESATMFRDGQQVKLTATFALADIRPGDRDIHQSLQRADEALYEGKRRGRNCVISSKVA